VKTPRLVATMTTAATAVALALSLLTVAPAVAETSVSVAPTYDTETPEASPAPESTSGRLVMSRKGQTLSVPKQVEVGSTFAVKGKVSISRKKKRTVGVFEKKGRKWRLLAKKKTSKKGSFVFTVKAGSKTKERLMAVAASRSRGTKGYEKHFAVKVVTATPPPPVEVPTTAAAGLDKPSTTTYGAPINITGAVGGAAAAGRLVVIEQALRSGWVEITRTTSNADGTFAVALPADFAWTSSIRAFVPAVPGAAAAYSGESTGSVTPNWALPGDPNSFTFIGGKRARWNPCAPIRVKVNYAQQPLTNTRAHVEQALAHVRAASGLSFVIVGDTNAYAWPAAGHAGADAETDLLISFGTQANTTVPIAGSVLGMGGPTYYNTTDYAGAVGLITKGQVIIDVNPAEHRFTDATLANVLRHEIGHAVGMGHTPDAAQIMYPMVTPNLTFGAGDYTNLSQHLGRAAGCLTIPGVNARRGAPTTVALP
jgi:hypothetical protein